MLVAVRAILKQLYRYEVTVQIAMFISTLRLLFVAVSFFFCVTSSFAIEVESNLEQQVLSRHLHYITASELTANTISEVRSASGLSWLNSEQDFFNFGPTAESYWFRTEIHNNDSESLERLLEFNRPFLDIVDVYLFRDGKKIAEYQMGDMRPFSNRPIANTEMIIPLSLPANSKTDLYVYVNSSGAPFHFVSRLWKVHSFYQAKYPVQAFNLLMLGGILSIGIYNLLLFFSTRETAYGYYFGYVISVVVIACALMGWVQQLMFSNNPYLNQFLPPVFGSSLRIFVYLFALNFLSLAAHLPRVAKVIWGLVIVDSIIALLLLLTLSLELLNIYSNIYVVFIRLYPIHAVVCFIVGFALLMRGLREARYFVIAWSILTLSIVVNGLMLSGLIPFYPRMQELMMAAHLLEMLLLSFALADRINITRAKQVRLLAAETQAKIAHEKALEDQAVAIEQQNLAIAEQARSLEHSNANVEMKSALLTAISHELRTPMNAIVGGLQAAQKTPGEPLTSPLDIVQRGASDMMHLVDDIIYYTEINANQQQVLLESVSTKVLFAELEDRYLAICEGENLAFKFAVVEPMPLWLQLDAEKIQTVLAKLLDNAVKFTKQGSVKCRLECTKNDKDVYQLTCVVEDTGIGIADQDRDKIFDAFYQVNRGYQRCYGGIGIGLTICQELVSLLDGEIQLETSSEGGSCFRVVIPVLLGRQSSNSKGQNQVDSTLPVLVVEDNVVNQKVMVKLLEKLGYQSLIANHGEEALEILQAQSVSLILMDIQMPVMDGFSCTQAIRNGNDDINNIPVIAVSANLIDSEKDYYEHIGFNDYLKKPVRLERLRNTLIQYLSADLSNGRVTN